MRKLVYAKNINNQPIGGIIDISENPPKLYCYCSKIVADEILENKYSESDMRSVSESFDKDYENFDKWLENYNLPI